LQTSCKPSRSYWWRSLPETKSILRRYWPWH